MKLTQTKKEVQTITKNEIVKADTNLDAIKQKVLYILTNMYKNNLIFIREIMSNAWDSHIEAGCPNKPIVIDIIREDNHTIIKMFDVGIGMSPERFHKFASYGQSTKDNTDTMIGGYGIGAKSIYAAPGVRGFNVQTIKNNIKYNYFCFLDEDNTPSYTLNSKEATEEGNSTLITVKLDENEIEYDTIKEECKNLLLFDNIVFKGQISDYNDYKIHKFHENYYGIEKNGEIYRNSLHQIILGQVPYDLNSSTLNSLSGEQKRFIQKFYVRFDISELTPLPSRQDYYHDSKKDKLIKDKIDECIAHFKDLVKGSNDFIYDNLTNLDSNSNIFYDIKNSYSVHICLIKHKNIFFDFDDLLDKVYSYSYETKYYFQTKRFNKLLKFFSNEKILLKAILITKLYEFHSKNTLYLTSGYNKKSFSEYSKSLIDIVYKITKVKKRFILFDNLPSSNFKKKYLKDNYDVFIKKNYFDNHISEFLKKIPLRDKKLLLKNFSKKLLVEVINEVEQDFKKITNKFVFDNIKEHIKDVDYPKITRDTSKVNFSFIRLLDQDKAVRHSKESINSFIDFLKWYKRYYKQSIIFLAPLNQANYIKEHYANIPICVIFLGKQKFKSIINNKKVMEHLTLLSDFHKTWNKKFIKYSTKLILGDEENIKVLNWYLLNQKFFITNKYNFLNTSFIDNSRLSYDSKTDDLSKTIVKLAVKNKLYDHKVISNFNKIKELYHKYNEILSMINVSHNKKEKVFAILFTYFKNKDNVSN